jgi:hypothetical protein
MVTVDNGVNIDFMNADREIAQQHYAFLVSESDFDESSVESASERFPIGPIPRKSNEVRSIITMAGAVSISRIPMAIS